MNFHRANGTSKHLCAGFFKLVTIPPAFLMLFCPPVVAEDWFQPEISQMLAADDDGDGTTNISEIQNGTDPKDRGSRSGNFSSPVYELWNGFLELNNVLELFNPSDQETVVTLSMHSVDGSQASAVHAYFRSLLKWFSRIRKTADNNHFAFFLP